ncbi:uncharacterized protein il17rel [Clupea harengus]|uniref:Uncharacterized protein il17rel n=1 Tax=Clupea harengus TaxID=7950 RepID=A0A6P8GHJ2_CLUHA|nr:uncharacterized protein il17rel [Clupea harengus]
MRSALLMLMCLHSCVSHGYRIENIQQCGAHCNKGLLCKSKRSFSFARCKKPPKGLQDNVFLNMSVSTVMKCEGRQQCSPFLQVSSTLLMNEHVKGISMCTMAAGMMERCRTLRFPKAALKRLSARQVEVQDNCFEVGVGQDLRVTLKTLPEFCNSSVSKTHNVPGCSHVDLQGNVPECIAGKITYQLDSDRRELSVSVTDMLENTDYNLRLCHKGYLCRGTGAYELLKKEDPVKNAVLQYARPLPCLCIEGWSSVFDAPRIQVCPFKNNMEELWSGVAFDSVQQILSWEPACQTEVVVTLCQKTGESVCQNLADASQSVTKGKVLFSTVDPHPQLCMKFTTKTASWIKCPFAGSNFTAWDIGVVMENVTPRLLVTSKIRPTLSLSVCRRTGPVACEEHNDVITFTAVKYQSLVPNLSLSMCAPNCCIQARRVDVKYAAIVLHCDFRFTATGEAPGSVRSGPPWESACFIAPAVGVLTALLVAILMLGTALTTIIVYQNQCGAKICHDISASQHNAAQCSTSVHWPSPGSVNASSAHNTLPPTHYHYPAFEDIPNLENNEKTNLLNWVKKDSTV